MLPGTIKSPGGQKVHITKRSMNQYQKRLVVIVWEVRKRGKIPRVNRNKNRQIFTKRPSTLSENTMGFREEELWGGRFGGPLEQTHLFHERTCGPFGGEGIEPVRTKAGRMEEPIGKKTGTGGLSGGGGAN